VGYVLVSWQRGGAGELLLESTGSLRRGSKPLSSRGTAGHFLNSGKSTRKKDSYQANRNRGGMKEGSGQE